MTDTGPPSRSEPPATPAVIVAVSGAGAEVVATIQHPHPRSDLVQVVAIVGQGTLLADLAASLEVPLLDSLSLARPGTAVVYSAVGPALDAANRNAMADGDHHPVTLIHADATIGPGVTMGPGCLVSPGVRITANVTVGRCGQFHTGAIVSHDDVIGDHVTLSPGVTLCGGVTIGDRSTVFAGATVMPGVTIGSDAVVGAGALVNRDVADGITVAGVPAKPLSPSR